MKTPEETPRDYKFELLLGKFARLQKMTPGFIVPIHPLLHVEQPGSHWVEFSWNFTLDMFTKTVDHIQILSWPKNRHFTGRLAYTYVYFAY